MKSLDIYHKTLGGHVHCRVFIAGRGKLGDIVFGVDDLPFMRSVLLGNWIEET